MGILGEFIFTVLGGFIAGVIGIFSTYISLRARRKEKHLDEHKMNLRVLKTALINGKGNIWPFVYGAENLSLDHEYKFNNEISNNGLKFIITHPVTASFDDENNIVMVDIVLYNDIKNHFPKLLANLNNANDHIKKYAKIIYKNLNIISPKIYDKLLKEDINFYDALKTSAVVQHGPLINNTKIEFKDLPEQNKYWFAGDVFLFTIKEDENNWPNAIRYLKNTGLYDSLKNKGNDVHTELENEINEMLNTRMKLFNDLNSAEL